jgi:NitT/TauT family transport system substrate-binding protein
LGYTADYGIDRLYNTRIYQNALESLARENPGDAVYRQLQARFAANE